ncbi:MAG: hypothetical protein NT133_16300 [Alphaproteobacteria bacterium]|nr:hypothetical protein [Alphaproteobacteria bacterium]
MSTSMPDGINLSTDLPAWTRLAIADAVVLFGRIEQEVIEIAWLLADAGMRERLKLARAPATENFIAIIDCAERAQGHQDLGTLKSSFVILANDRNLIVHGAWAMADGKPWVVWHKFIEDTDSIIGEYFESRRFARFLELGSTIPSFRFCKQSIKLAGL